MGMSTISTKQTSEPRKRLTKLRSIKVVSLDRSRSSLKHKKSGLTRKLIITDEMSKQSPNYMRPTSCSNAKRGSLKPKSGDGSTKIRSSKRLLSLKRSRQTNTTRSIFSCDTEASISCDIPHYLGRGVEANTQLTKSGSIKLKTRKSLKFPRRQWSSSRFNKASIFRTDDESPQEPPFVQGNDMDEGTSSYYARKNQVSNSVDATDLKPVRALWKIPSLRNRRLLIKKQSKILECSSTINSNKLRYSKPEVCQYKYCSVHGSVHASSLQLSLLSKKQKSRRRKQNPVIEKVQMQEFTIEDLAGPSDKIGSDMWNLIYNHYLLHKNEVSNEAEFAQQAVDEKTEFSQVEAVEFVKQAVDEILLLDEQLNDTHQVEDSSAIKLLKLSRSKGFKKIRKLIATTKFIKAMEKRRKEHAQKDMFLTHFSMGETKGTEEWMLDAALQQVISKLDPAQQRRVGILIEAFECVTQDTKIYCNSDHERVEQPESVMGTVLEEDSNGKEMLSQVYVESRGTTDDGGAKSVMKVAKKLAESTQEIIHNCKVDGSVGKDINFHFDKEKFTNVWHQVYHHFIGSEATELGNDGVEVKKKNVDEIKDTESGHLNQANAIRLVQEAIDELIHLQEQLSDQLPSEIHNNEEENLVERDKVCGEKAETKGMPLQQQKSNAYNKLRKMVVSAKFISAMEKVRKIKPQNVSLEAKRLYPRHWSMEDRKMSEGSMLDCALQDVINKLAPAQQKKVAMLTQAFETFSTEIQEMNKGSFYDIGSTNITENEQKKSIIIDQDDPIVYKDDIETPDDEVPSFLEDALKTNHQPGDDKNEAFDEIDIQVYYKNVELSGVNLHIHEMGSTKGCLVCHPHKFPKDEKEENVEHHSRDLGDNINSYYGNESFSDENKNTNMRKVIHQEGEIKHAKKDDLNTKGTELQQNEAIKFVQEAVDEILQMPEEPFHDQSIIPEDKSLQEVTGSYKVIVCKKFVKAIEKMKRQRSKVDSCQLESTPKRIHPKQQKENEMKNDELMLDFALQRAISNLGPAQKKKVSMLVQAFERVAQ